MSYVDGFIVPVPKKKLKVYLAMAKKFARVWKDHGALEVKECVGDGLKKGKVTSFMRAVKVEKGEVVFFSYIVHRSRAARDKTIAKVMKDPRIAEMMDPDNVPFDGMRMIMGGFKVVVDE